ncbi:hypothetical protein Z951_34210 [Streptomyces sp. PRh5]|nr:hypothetical protein Z951_34210 [Streptomyces sp. PRh5]
MSREAPTASSWTCRCPIPAPVMALIRSHASANEPLDASIAASLASPRLCIPAGRFSSASARCRSATEVPR